MAETQNCKNCKLEFTLFPDDLTFYKAIDVPLPTLCPECRYVRRLLDRNEYNLYKRTCDATGKTVLSIYRPEAPFPVYNQEYWKSDAFDATSYGRDFDFNRPFFEQYEELRRKVPHLALVNSNSANSEYTNQAQNDKDCYMLVTSDSCEKSMYGNWCQKCFMSSDCSMADRSEFCYECMSISKSANCAWLQDSSDCVNVYLSINCRGCTDCFGCVDLRNKKYCWFNEQLDKTEYEKKLKEFPWTRASFSEAQSALLKLRLTRPVKYYHGAQTENSSGDYIENTQRARMAFNCRDNKDTAYMQDAWNQTENCRDCTEIIVGQLAYEVQGVDSPHRTIVARSCFNNITDSCYCDMCFGANACFGCFGLKQKQYCILNKQYSKEDYLALKAKIIEHMKKTGEWGEYFPPAYSPFAYNESMAQDYFPLTREEALGKGYPWYDAPAKNYEFTLKSADLPQTIKETGDSILNEVIQCATQESEEEKKTHSACTTAFRLIPLELALYRKLNIPVPSKCYPCRRIDRFAKRNPRKLWKRICQCAGAQSENGTYKNSANHSHSNRHCEVSFETSYEPRRPEIIYCENCYQSEVA